MINVIGRDLIIPKVERFVGMQSDNKVETRQFEVTDTALFDFNFKLDLGNGVNKDIVDLTKEIQEDKVILIWEITRENLINDGILYAQLRAYSDNDEVWHTNIDYFEVKSSINATEYYPDVLPSEFMQMEQRVTAIQSDVTSKAAEVESDRAEVAANTETVSGLVNGFDAHVTTKTGEFDLNATAKIDIVNGKAAEALQSATNAKTSEDNAEESAANAFESETNADESARIAANNLLNGVSTHNADAASHPSILSDIDRVEAIARGKATAKVFLTVAAMNDWLAITENVETLNIGDNLYIVDISVPDYWWDGTQAQVLEAEAVNLADYYTKTEVDNRLPETIEQTDYDALVAAGTVIAGRIYYVVPDGELT